jgi:hypothetical protein
VIPVAPEDGDDADGYCSEHMFVSSGTAPLRPSRARSGDPTTLGELAERVRPTTTSRARLLPVPPALAALLPDGALRRGSVVRCSGGGALSLALAAVGAASAAGSWCGLVGVDDVGALAAAGYGVDLHRLAVVRAPAAHWAVAAGRLLDGFDVVVVRPPGRPRPPVVRSLAARARERQAVLVVLGDRTRWPEPADVGLQVAAGRWHGLDRGAGRLQARRVTVVADGRGPAVRPVRRELWLPAATGRVAAA